MLAYNATNYEEIAQKRFEENIGVLNFYFDTPIITQIQLELRYRKRSNFYQIQIHMALPLQDKYF